ncbi:MAG: ABC transporter permease [Acidobacteriota bacterium]
MFSYVLRRVLFIPPVLLVGSLVSFLLILSAKGGPFDQERAYPPQVLENLNKKFHLGDPVITQYGIYLRGLLRGDMQISLKYRNRTVSEIIAQTFPVSLGLGLVALAIALAIGISAGTIAAVRHNSPVDHAAMTLAMVGISIPNFVMGPVLILLLVFWLRLLPVGGWGSVGQIPMPAIVLGLPYAAYIARLSRAGMLDVVRQDYMRTAKAKGLRASSVIVKHGLKNAMLPVISFLGPATAGIVTGSVVVEKLFEVPGIGTFFVNSALNRDLFVEMGILLLYASLLLVLNLAVDVAYTFVDPRVELG